IVKALGTSFILNPPLFLNSILFKYFYLKTAGCTFSKSTHPIKAPATLLIMNEGIKKNAPCEIPITYLEKGTENNEEITPVPIISPTRSEEHTSELQSRFDLVCRLLLEKKKKKNIQQTMNE